MKDTVRRESTSDPCVLVGRPLPRRQWSGNQAACGRVGTSMATVPQVRSTGGLLAVQMHRNGRYSYTLFSFFNSLLIRFRLTFIT